MRLCARSFVLNWRHDSARSTADHPEQKWEAGPRQRWCCGRYSSRRIVGRYGPGIAHVPGRCGTTVIVCIKEKSNPLILAREISWEALALVAGLFCHGRRYGSHWSDGLHEAMAG